MAGVPPAFSSLPEPRRRALAHVLGVIGPCHVAGRPVVQVEDAHPLPRRGRYTGYARDAIEAHPLDVFQQHARDAAEHGGRLCGTATNAAAEGVRRGEFRDVRVLLGAVPAPTAPVMRTLLAGLQ